jgi:hypothetical protein
MIETCMSIACEYVDILGQEFEEEFDDLVELERE